jgi:hypothetical protein
VPILPLRLSRSAVLVLVALALCGNSSFSSAHAQSQSFKALITLTQSTVSNNRIFTVMTSVQNTGITEHLLDVWSCSYSDQWIPDSPLIHVDPENCLMNTHGKVRLGPGKSYRRTIRIHTSLTSGPDHPASVTFRLGFVQATLVKGVAPVPGSSPLWSNPVTITVNR